MPLTAEQYLTALEITKQMKFRVFLQCKMCNDLLFTVTDFIAHKSKFCEDTVVSLDEIRSPKPNTDPNEKISTLVVMNSNTNSTEEVNKAQGKTESSGTNDRTANKRKTDTNAKASTPKGNVKQPKVPSLKKQGELSVLLQKENTKITKSECPTPAEKKNCKIPLNNTKPVSAAKTLIVNNHDNIYSEFDWENCDFFDGSTCYVSEPIEEDIVKIEKPD